MSLVDAIVCDLRPIRPRSVVLHVAPATLALLLEERRRRGPELPEDAPADVPYTIAGVRIVEDVAVPVGRWKCYAL